MLAGGIVVPEDLSLHRETGWSLPPEKTGKVICTPERVLIRDMSPII